MQIQLVPTHKKKCAAEATTTQVKKKWMGREKRNLRRGINRGCH